MKGDIFLYAFVMFHEAGESIFVENMKV